MCIIIAKEKNMRLPKEEELKNCFTRNNDGAGFMYVEDGQVVIDKGYMTYNNFIKRFNDLCKKYNNFDNKSLVIHCRIGTSSGNIDKNTHPYPICGKEKTLHKLFTRTNLGIVHNGIIHDYTPTSKKPTTNDTQEFIMNYLYPLYKNWNDFYKNDNIRNGIESITNSKFVFLDTNDDLYYVGEFVEEDNLLFSNTTYKAFTYNYSYSGYNNLYNYNYKRYDDYGYDYDDYDYDYEYKPSSKLNELLLEEEKEDENEEISGYDDDNMVPLDNTWFIEHGYNFEEVGERDLVYDLETRELFKYSDNNTLIKMYDDVDVYDENYEMIY